MLGAGAGVRPSPPPPIPSSSASSSPTSRTSILESHVPQITSFWETILLGRQTYGGGAFAPHASLHRKVPLRAGHFERWLTLVAHDGRRAVRR